MNGIAFAGYSESSAEERAEKYFKIIIPKGSCTVWYDGGNKELCDGQIAVVPPFLKHRVCGRAVCVCLEQALLPFKELRIILDDKNGGIACAADQAVEYFSAKNSTQVGILAALGSLLVAYITAFAGGKNLSPVVETVCNEIHKNVSTPLFSLEDSIKKLPLHYDYVRKMFKKQVGVTPHEYLLNCRMQLARELFFSGIGNRYSNYSVGQIAEACGFSEPLYFSRVFKKFYGFSPSEARAKWIADDSHNVTK